MDGGEPLPQRCQRIKEEQQSADKSFVNRGKDSEETAGASGGSRDCASSEGKPGGKEAEEDVNDEDWYPGQYSLGSQEQGSGYEYLDHTADIQFHSWGKDLSEAFAQSVVCMFSYITDLGTVDETDENLVEVSGHDMESLLYAFMDEFLFQFCVDGFVAKRVKIFSFDRESWSISAKGTGEKFQPRVKHPQGTEIKAITYSAMRIIEHGDKKAETFVIVDI